MDRMFISRRSAVARIIEVLRRLRESVGADAQSAGGGEARVAELERLLFDVRARRMDQFTLPADEPVQVFITSE